VDIITHKSFEGFQPLFPSSKFSLLSVFVSKLSSPFASPKIRISSSLSLSFLCFFPQPFLSHFSISFLYQLRQHGTFSPSLTLHFFMQIAAYIDLYAYYIHHFVFPWTNIHLYVRVCHKML